MRNAKQRAAEPGGEDQELEARQDGAEQDDEAGDPEGGGSPGVPSRADGANDASAKITLPADMIVGSAKGPEDKDAPPPKQYVVVGGPYQVAYGSMIYQLKHGRQLSDASHPIELLRRQGVRLDPVAAP